MLVTCHTPDCDNAGHPIDLTFTADDDGNPVTPDLYVCGVCGQVITDVAPA